MKKELIQKSQHRKRTGAFYTPKVWADFSHKIITNNFGFDWKEKYIVYDPCCGQCALTKDYIFSNLYLSTLEQEDIDFSIKSDYNKEANFFQYDFLSEIDFDSVPNDLRNGIEQKKVLVFMNPPYGTAKNGSTKENDSKKGISSTVVGLKMKEDGLGTASQQLYAQFIYKISLKKLPFCIFSPPLFLCGPSFDKFRKKVLSNYDFIDGVLFQASHFDDLNHQWGISFTLWKPKE